MCVSGDIVTWRTSEQVQHDCMKNLDKPGLLSRDLDLNFTSKFILLDSIRGKLHIQSVSFSSREVEQLPMVVK